MGAMANESEAIYVGWEEVVVCSEKGRREVHYFLKRGGGGGGRDLVVVGKEEGVRDLNLMVYDYVGREGGVLVPGLNRVSGLKLRGRRDVIDWLNSIVSDGQVTASSRLSYGERENKDTRIRFLNHHVPGFAWLGSSWACRKRRHYESFCRNGAIVSIHDFVYVLSKENKRLVAYLEDMYEDAEGNKRVSVRWFHKIDEVGIDLPGNYNDREIFFSLCLQEISVECIDGLATVLSPEHYDKFSKEAVKSGISPFVCYRQFDNDDLKPFEVTAIEGYWKQELLRKSEIPFYLKTKTDGFGSRRNKRSRCSYNACNFLKLPNQSNDTGFLCRKNDTFPKFLTVGSCIEVLSQDSGMKGCWFRASVIKKRKDKVKVKYRDVKDAEDESKYLEEWIPASRVASKDASGIRLFGRPTSRPSQLDDDRKVRRSLSIGSIVDAWWHDGWWEGIVIKMEAFDKITVHFPGENQAVFSLKDLRYSKEWLRNQWEDMDARPDIASKYCREKDEPRAIKPGDESNNVLPKCGASWDISQDRSLFRLRWVSSGKKRYNRRGTHFVKTPPCSSSMNGDEISWSFDKMFRTSSENCKFRSFGSDLVSSSLSNVLMMSM